MFVHASRLMIVVTLLLAAASLPAQSFREKAIEAAQRGETDVAIANYELALHSALKVFKEDDSEIITRRLELGEAYRAGGKWDAAIGQLEYVWKRTRYDAEQKNEWKGEAGRLAYGSAEKLGRCLQGKAQYADAAVVFATAISDADRAGEEATDVTTVEGLLADTLLLLDRVSEADRVIERSAERIEKRNANNPEARARLFSTLATIYYHHKHYAKALPYAEKAHYIASTGLPPGDPVIAGVLSNLGSILLHKNDRLDEAVQRLKEAEEIYLKNFTPESPELMSIQLNLSQAESLRGQHQAAEKYALEALRVCRLNFANDSVETGKCLHNLASCYVSLKQPGKAGDLYGLALANFEKGLGHDHPQTKETRALMESLQPK